MSWRGSPAEDTPSRSRRCARAVPLVCANVQFLFTMCCTFRGQIDHPRAPLKRGIARAYLHCGGFVITPLDGGSALAYLTKVQSSSIPTKKMGCIIQNTLRGQVDMAGYSPASFVRGGLARQPLAAANIRDILAREEEAQQQ